MSWKIWNSVIFLYIATQLFWNQACKCIVIRVMTLCFIQEETLKELQQLASKLPWTNALEVWKQNGTLKKKKGYRKGGNGPKVKPASDAAVADAEQQELPQEEPAAEGKTEAESTPDVESSTQDLTEAAPEAKLIKFRVTCSRAGDKHSFSSNEAARDFGGAVQEFFQWKADMTKFDIEVDVLVQTELTQREHGHSSQRKSLAVQINLQSVA